MNTLIKRLRNHILLQILLVAALAAVATWLFVQNNWLWGGICVILLACAVWQAVRLYRSQVRKVIFLLDAIENNDNGIRFSEEEGTTENKEVNQLLNRVSHILYDAKARTQQQEKYYELILNCINTGIVVLNDNGAVYQKNNELLHLLGLEVFTHIRQLSRIDHLLMQRISTARTGDKFHVSFNNEHGNVNLSVRVSDITIGNEHLRIFALNDINSELDEKELDSWIRLIRVLTHEIMNSITPITSLSDTLLSIAQTKDEEIYKGLQMISSTGKGLLSFVDSYRKFTRIPTPEPSLFYVKPFIDRMVALAKHQNLCNNITFTAHTEPDDLIVYADENLISQVIINLLKNAIEAIGLQSDGNIKIHSYCNSNEEVIIEISNNGPRITPEVAEQIFVPFFTTKQGGSGIGLSLSRQIMRLSGGRLTLLPPNQIPQTTFVLLFK